MHVMLSSGISAVRALRNYCRSGRQMTFTKRSFTEAVNDVKAGSSMSATFAKYPEEIPVILVQMLQIGEETGEMGNILGSGWPSFTSAR